ncbi:MAG: response regulator [Fibrobacteria bacterium]|nr:response regulator [Fibrobacteria bacterium]
MNSKGAILIVDDNPRNIQVLGSMLRENGYSISAVLNGPDALSILRGVEVDLVLLDVMMPGMSGLEVCREMKSTPSLAEIPVIFLTALSDAEDVLRGFEAGGVDYVTKPFRAAELLARVKVHVSLRQARREIFSLQEILPICSSCKNIRNDDGYWIQVESYLSERSDLRFSHGICPKCMEELYPGATERIAARHAAQKRNPPPADPETGGG